MEIDTTLERNTTQVTVVSPFTVYAETGV
jgi:hypothetical protein